MYMIWFVAVLLIIVILSILPITLVIQYDKDFDFCIKILCFRIKPLKSKNKSKKATNSKDKRAEKKQDIFQLSKKIISMADDIKDILAFISQRCMVVNNLEFLLDFGTGDAASTGIACGGINGVCYTAMAAIHNNTIVKKWRIEINPDFKREIFSICFMCIARTRLLHIISIVTKGLKMYTKFKRL